MRKKLNLGAAVVDGAFEKHAPMPEPEVDEEGYYLKGEWLDALAAHPFDPHEAERFMVETFPKAVGLMGCPSVSVEETTNEYGEEVTRIRFATGGWSGAEDLIHVCLCHLWIRQLHTEWKQGGLYVFEVLQ